VQQPLSTVAISSIRSTGSVFFHADTFNGTADCVNCHNIDLNKSRQAWTDGIFNHQNFSGAPISTCFQCHNGKRPAALVGTPPFDHAKDGTGDCVTCHTTPGIAWSSAKFNHTPIPVSCNTCHQGTRPAPATLLPAVTPKNQFVHSTQFNGTSDCVECHIRTPANVGVTFAGGAFSHLDLNGTKVQTCIPCHTQERPVGLIGSPAFNHGIAGLGDCATCHKNPGVVWSGASFSHVPTPAACISCHLATRPLAATYVPAAAPNKFAHSTLYKGDQDCSQCHGAVPANIGTSWAGAFFDHKTNLGANVTTCANCHTSRRPIGPAGTTMFNHATGPGGLGDCVGCHTKPGVNWATVAFSHSPLPVTCVTCHNSRRPDPALVLPVAATANLFTHSIENNGTGDCVSCHNKVPLNAGVTWAGGFFNHKNNLNQNVATCYPCHQQERPVGLIGSPVFNHATAGTGDCVSCHKNPGVAWSGASFNHTPTPTSCNTCHNGIRPNATTLYPVGVTTSQYVHATQFNGTADCVSCHTTVTANIGVRWAGGKFNHKSNTGATVTSCAPCHNVQRPAGIVGASLFNHTANGAGDCGSCHKSPGVAWTGGKVSHTPTPVSCNVCHNGIRPAATTFFPSPTANGRYAHTATYKGTADCVGCHINVITNVGVRWSGGYFDHKTSAGAKVGNTTCVNCHTTGAATFYSHSNAAGSKRSPPCSSCH
jgi:Class III cytochrome C family